jgi:hypothetical protein
LSARQGHYAEPSEAYLPLRCIMSPAAWQTDVAGFSTMV